MHYHLVFPFLKLLLGIGEGGHIPNNVLLIGDGSEFLLGDGSYFLLGSP
jgi:hypothetical protein